MNTLSLTSASKLGAITLVFALGAISNLRADNTFTSLDFPGSIATQAWGITLNGDIVGFYTSSDKAMHGFLRSRGQWASIDYPGAMYTSISGISPRGDIIGDYAVTLNGSGPHHGYVLDIDGNFTTIDYPGATSTFAVGMNSHGDILGYYLLNDTVSHMFVMTADPFVAGGQFKDLAGCPEATNIGPLAITGNEIVGLCVIGGTTHAFLYSDGQYLISDSVPGATYTNAVGINTRGEIVGRYILNGVTHAYLRSGGNFTSYDAPGATFTGFTAISSTGAIVGRWRDASNVFHGFLLSGFQTACAVPTQ